MRLEKIKLAGFKSFVDPTTVHLPSNLVAIVGPNGCGKSNVIDAVRWVMGESSAKMLRGESMADVIFNGSNSRKPVGTASIELIFDNQYGSAGGEYAQYSQISVKRQVSRDGQSQYYMNGHRCRRRDITDLFLGTGLGPRSYSIIEQGMISRLIEAKPEDLRAFLEEAAGISKYKERRRETQNRIARTRENLDRLNDLREEVEKQLQHLKRQAATAERYQAYKQQERRLQAELLALRWRILALEGERQQAAIREQETALEAAIARQRRLEAEIEQARDRHTDANDRFNTIQGQFYAVGGEIARLEQAIQFARENRAQMENDLHLAEQAWQESSDHRRQDQARLEELNEGLAEEEPRLAEARASDQALAEQLATAEQAMQAWQQTWEEFNRQAAEPAQLAQVERTRINHLEQQEQNLQRRIQRFDEELSRLDDPALAEEIGRLEAREQEQREQMAEAEAQLRDARERIAARREENRSLARTLDQARAELQAARGRLASLEVLQEAALGSGGGEVTDWLERHHLQGAARLAQNIEVEKGWERAVETALGFHLQALCVERVTPLAETLTALEEGQITLFETDLPAPAGRLPANALAARIRSPWPLQPLLHGVLTADHLAQALTMRETLQDGQSVITREGIWLGKGWLRLDREQGGHSGILEREQELRALQDRTALLAARVEELEATLEQGRTTLGEAEQGREAQQRRLDEVHRQLSDLRSALSGKRARAEHLRNRRANITDEVGELRQQIGEGREALQAARSRLHQALEEMETLSERREALIARRDDLRGRLEAIRREARQQRAATQERALRIESMRSARDALVRNLARMEGQVSHLENRRAELKLALEEGEAPLQQLREELELQLARRIEVETELTRAREELAAIDATLRELEQGRSGADQAVQAHRARLDQTRLQYQELVVRRGTLEEQLEASGFQRQSLLEELPADADPEQWQQEVERMDARIRRLGPINLAAIEEYQEQSERMQYLDAQHADVTESLETLENAIRKIDRETRTRFKETFDKVNQGLQQKFPRLFGGGHAYLQLTGEDLLDTGVTVMARPPGKRNSSIHMLSGGEKALTAVALVFAIFELNPAPFCMLDEVDAPLDDANVGRFCDMVKSMSEQVQFIFITHSKITMEIANQLTGVTMHEPGVSRLVSVDVDEAAQMAAV